MGLRKKAAAALLMFCLVVPAQGVLAKAPILTDVGLKGRITTDDAIKLSWKAQPGASFYLVYRAQTLDGQRLGRYKHIGTAYDTSYVDSTVRENCSYKYFLRYGSKNRTYQSSPRNIQVGLTPPRFLMARDGAGEYTTTDYNRITLVTGTPVDGLPDQIQLQKKAGKKFRTLETKPYEPGSNGIVTFVDKDVRAGIAYTYRARVIKGEGEKRMVSEFSTIELRALNQVGKYTAAWVPRPVELKDGMVLKLESQSYNYGLKLDGKNTCELELYDAAAGKTTEGTGRIAASSPDGKKWKKAKGGFSISEGTAYLWIRGEGAAMDKVAALTIPGTYDGKTAALSMKNQMKLYYLNSETVVEFYGKTDRKQ